MTDGRGRGGAGGGGSGGGRGGRRRGRAGGRAAAVGWNVATNGARTGVGSTTGTLSTARVTAGVPSSTLTVPLAGITWTEPAWSSPAHTVVPDELVDRDPAGAGTGRRDLVVGVDDRVGRRRRRRCQGHQLGRLGGCRGLGLGLGLGSGRGRVRRPSGSRRGTVVCPVVAVWLPLADECFDPTYANTPNRTVRPPRSSPWWRGGAGGSSSPRRGAGPDRCERPGSPRRIRPARYRSRGRASSKTRGVSGSGNSSFPRTGTGGTDRRCRHPRWPRCHARPRAGNCEEPPTRARCVPPHLRHHRWRTAIGEVLEGAQGRVVAPHGIQIVAARSSEDHHDRHGHCDQCHGSEGDPHPDYSTRRDAWAGAGPRSEDRIHSLSWWGGGSTLNVIIQSR